MHVAPTKAKCDRQTNDGQSDRYVALCFTCPTKTVALYMCLSNHHSDKPASLPVTGSSVTKLGMYMYSDNCMESEEKTLVTSLLPYQLLILL